MDRSRLEDVGFLVLLLVALVPLFVGDTYWNPDGPRHVEMASVARTLLTDPDAPEAAFFTLADRPVPVVLLPAMLAPLAHEAPIAVERLAWLVYFLGLPLAFRWIAGRATAAPQAWLVFPLLWTLSTAMGLLNFLQSLILFVLALGLALELEGRSKAGLVGLVTSALILVLTHPLTFWVTGASVGIVLLWRGWLDGDGRALLRRLAWTAAGTGPAALLALTFSLASEGGAHWQSGPVERLGWLATLDQLLVWGPTEFVAALATGLALAGLTGEALAHRRPAEPRDALLLVALFGLLFFLVVPDLASGGSLAARRSPVFVYLPWALWLATEPTRGLARTAGASVAAAALLVQVAVGVDIQRQHHRDRLEILAIEPADLAGQTVLPVVFAPAGLTADGAIRSARVAPFDSIGADLARRRRAIDLLNFQATQSTFVVRYRPGMCALDDVPADRSDAHPLPIDPAAWERRTGRTVDHVIVFGWQESLAADPDAAEVMARVEAGWTLARTSPTGVARWYERRSER